MRIIPNIAAILGNLSYIRGDTAKAVRFLEYAVTHRSTSPQAHLNYGLYLLRGGRAQDAAPMLNRALILSKKVLPQKHIKLTQASCAWAMGDVDGAIEILEKMRRDYDYVNASVLSSLGYMYVEKGDLTKGEEFSRAAIEDTSGTYSAWDNLGQIFYRREQFAEAREAFNKALEYKEKLPDSLYYLGLIARVEGDGAAANDCFSRALDCEITALNTVTREMIEAAMRGA